jgi:hypothetical protein
MRRTRTIRLLLAAALTAPAWAIGAGTAEARTAVGDVLVVGDSLCNQARRDGDLDALMAGTGMRVEYACSGGQPLSYGTLRLLERESAPPILVVALGTNQSASPEAFAAEAAELHAVARSRGVRTLHWLTNAVRTPLAIPLEVHIPEQNDVVNDLGRYPDIFVEDWAAVLGAEPHLWDGDGVHYTPAGAARYAGFLTDAALAGRASLYSQQVRNLYLASFGREPDRDGRWYWTLRMWWGLPLDVVAGHFAASSEFRNRYSATDDARFVEIVYENVLRRSPDPGGLAYWTGRLRSGMSRGDLLSGFSESPEFIDLLHRTTGY